MKTCIQCAETKHLEDYYRALGMRDGRQSRCKECHKHNMRILARTTARTRKLLHHAKQRAEKMGWEFTITEEDIYIPETCPVLGMELIVQSPRGKGGGSAGSPSLDRINPALGYIPGNVQVISHLANTMKCNATPEELLMFADWVYKTYGGF